MGMDRRVLCERPCGDGGKNPGVPIFYHGNPKIRQIMVQTVALAGVADTGRVFKKWQFVVAVAVCIRVA